MAAAFLSVKKLREKDALLKAARHNLREIYAENRGDGHIDPSRSHLNRVLEGAATARAIDALAKSEAPEKLRRDAVRAIEVLVSLKVDQSAAVDDDFFFDALEWVRSFFGVRVLSAVVHRDEESPHAHYLLLPLVNGRMVGSDLIGNKSRLRNMQESFYRGVAAGHGLSKPASAKRQSMPFKDGAAQKIYDAIRADPSVLSKPDVRFTLCQTIASNPAPILEALGLEMPDRAPRRGKTVVEIMTKPVKRERCKPYRVCLPVGGQELANPTTV